MKKLILLLGLLLTASTAMAQGGWSYFVEYSNYITVEYDSTDLDTIYVLLPDTKQNVPYISETLPTKYYHGTVLRDLRFSYDGNVVIHCHPDTSTGMTNTETDSLSQTIKPLTYDPYLGTFEISQNDYTYLVFDTPETYTATSADWLDWTSAKTYTCTLSGELLPVAGFVIIGDQRNSSAGIASVKYWLSFTRNWR